MICARCKRKDKGQSQFDAHHPAGEANHPMTVPIPVNDHRAELSTAQHDWPKRTLENPYRSPLLKAAACVRGFIDTLFNLIKRLLGWIPECLEALDEKLTRFFGIDWWTTLGLERFAPTA